MSPESWGFIGALAGAIVGAAASIITTVINSKNAIRIQGNIEKGARIERYREFQRNNLLELQEKLTEGMRLTSLAFIEDMKNYKESKKWGSSYLSDELDENIGISLREISIRIERIGNDNLREQILRLRKMMIESQMADSYDVAKQKQKMLAEAFNDLMPRLGVVLRENY